MINKLRNYGRILSKKFKINADTAISFILNTVAFKVCFLETFRFVFSFYLQSNVWKNYIFSFNEKNNFYHICTNCVCEVLNQITKDFKLGLRFLQFYSLMLWSVFREDGTKLLHLENHTETEYFFTQFMNWRAMQFNNSIIMS